MIAHPDSRSRALILPIALMGLLAISLRAQSMPAPATPDLACEEEISPDTVKFASSLPDSEGFLSMFDGTFRGWFQSCITGHSISDRAQGAIFRVGMADGRPAIYTNTRGTAGGVMMTHRKFANYELRFQIWPEFGNEAGIFNRTPLNGRCYRTTLSYAPGGSLGGVWGEGGFTSRDFRPFAMTGSQENVTVPGNSNGELSNWTQITRKIKATTQPDLPCPDSGCTQADWNLLWDKDGWNDIRIQFYGGASDSSGKIHMKSWFKKPAAIQWIPIIQDTSLLQIVPPGRIGIEVHGGGIRFSGSKGIWYRDIRYAELDSKGQVVPEANPAGLAVRKDRAPMHLSMDATRINGAPDRDYLLTVTDLRGRPLESFRGPAGRFSHSLTTHVRGILILRLRTERGEILQRVVRPF